MINQQIAIKTIKKFGFSVNAVWNGQEALDYLLEEPSPSHPKPDIILMDVQMPILDGYRATHLIRHHGPYTAIAGLRETPIVAMTASAIQGDMEKCMKAGMDDYLAKPVKGKTLENMLLKWAAEGKRKARLKQIYPSINQHIHQHDNNCSGRVSELSSTNLEAAPVPNPGHDVFAAAHDLKSSNALARIESEGERGLQRAEAEDKARSLRDDKLVAASSTDLSNLPESGTLDTSAARTPAPPAALTEENISQLDRAHDEAGSAARFSPPIHFPTKYAPGGVQHHTRNKDSGDFSSLTVQGRDSDSETASTVGSLRNGEADTAGAGGGGGGGVKRWMRRGLMRNDSDRSQVTVTQADVGRMSKGE
ncbi:MAG: hypothetical protein Q9225_001777 [Loekoesia sp. 1 TL-2023]